jgi:hypothetical protein
MKGMKKGFVPFVTNTATLNRGFECIGGGFGGETTNQ